MQIQQLSWFAAGWTAESIYRQRRQHVDAIVSEVIVEAAADPRLVDKLGYWMLRPLTGIPMLLLTLYAMYWVIGVFIAQTVVDFTEGVVMEQYYQPFVRQLVGQFISPQSPLGTILVGEFGIMTMTVTYVLGLLLP